MRVLPVRFRCICVMVIMRGAKQFGHGVGYVYAHDEPGHVAAQQYLPDTLRGTVYYEPTQHGFERTLTERRERIRRILDAAPVQDTAR